MKAFKQYRRIEGIAATRVRLGLSQQEFADQLGISRSLVAKAEGRQRTLPTSTIVKIASLEILLAGANSAKSAERPHPVEVEETYLNDHAPSLAYHKEMRCRAEALSLQCRLDVMEAKYKQLRLSLDQVETLVETGKGKEANFGVGYFEIHRHKLCRTLNKCSMPAQANLRHRIALLYAEAELHKSVHQEFS